jgi:hypothetical protein
MIGRGGGIKKVRQENARTEFCLARRGGTRQENWSVKVLLSQGGGKRQR